MLSLLCVSALVLQMLAPYLVWRSRWNVPTHLSVGFCVTAYLVPGLLTNVWDEFPASTAWVYTWMNVAGAVAIVTGTLLGARARVPSRLKNAFVAIVRDGGNALLRKRVETMVLVGIAGMLLAYAIMGFVPLFAEDPLSAKQFKGEYFEPYYRAAYLYRFSFSVLVASIPVVLTCWLAFSSRRFLMWGLLAAFLIGVSLARQSAAVGIITFLGFVAASRVRYFKGYLFFVSVVYPLGSAGYLLLGYALGIESLTDIYSVDSLFDIVASGAPDMFDQLTFLDGFYRLDTFTYGRTIFGGLVPGNFAWNPSVWTLTYDSIGADISETVSGGLRLSVALWGYANFGWIGVVLIPFISGFANGKMLALLKDLPFEKSMTGAAVVLTLYMTLGRQIVDFYMLSIHSLPSIACALIICFGMGKFWRREAPRRVAGLD